MREARATTVASTKQHVAAMQRRAEMLLEDLSEQREQIVLPTVLVAELLVKIDVRKHGDFIAALQERFYVIPFDLHSSSLAAKLWQEHKRLPKDQQLDRPLLKVDALIVATAQGAGATKFYSHEPKCRKLAELAGMADETEELLRIVEKDGTSQPLISQENSLVHHLSHLRLRTTRLYVVGLEKEADREKIEAVRREVVEWTR